MIEECFDCTDINVPYQFVRRNLNVVFTEENYPVFFREFVHYLLRCRLSEEAYGLIRPTLDGEELPEPHKSYFKNTFRRMFNNDEHLKGLVGERLLAFYYARIFMAICGVMVQKEEVLQNQALIILSLWEMMTIIIV